MCGEQLMGTGQRLVGEEKENLGGLFFFLVLRLYYVLL